MNEITRRELLKRLGLGAALATLPGSLLASCSGVGNTSGGRSITGPKPTDFEKISPVNRFHGTSAEFSGDNPDRLHALLRDKSAGLKGRKPILDPVVQKVVIVGGGMSGILSGYLLRDLKPVILDKGERFGGNSQGESWENVEYSIGAAYMGSPSRGTPLHALYQKAGVFEMCRKRNDTDPVMLNHKVFSNFWGGATDPAAAKQFLRLRDFFLERLHGKVAVPNIPALSEDELPLISELDRHDFLSYLVRQLGEPLHPHVHTLLEVYCWSTFGGSMQEVSAAIALSYYVAEFGEILVAAAGNASVAECFLRLFLNEVPAGNLRPQSVALEVKPVGDLVHVTYIDFVGVVRTIRAEAVVMAAPKFIAKHLIEGLEKDRADAFKQLEYRSYVVGNACLNRGPTRDIHDLYLLNEGEVPFGETRRNMHNHGTSDLVFANYSQVIKDRSVLTLYYPLPFEGGRAELLIPDAFEHFGSRIRKDLFEKILPTLGYLNTDLADLRLTRWGHAMPLAKPGFYWSGAPKALAKPFGSRIFFVNQDTWAAPAIETCAYEALKWTAKLREVVG
jgi:hypothetical protein